MPMMRGAMTRPTGKPQSTSTPSKTPMRLLIWYSQSAISRTVAFGSSRETADTEGRSASQPPKRKFDVLQGSASSGPSALSLFGRAASLEEGTGEATQVHGHVATFKSLQVSGTAPIAHNRPPARSGCCGPVLRINRSQIVSGARLHEAEGAHQADGWS